MLFYIKLIRWYYIFLTACALLAPLNYSLFQFLPALLLLWLSYFVFKAGCSEGIRKNVKSLPLRKGVDLKKIFIFFTLGMIIFIPLYVKFYTGGNLLSLALGFYSNVGTESNYQEYQRYFMENGIDQFSLSKLPFIAGYGITKLLFYFFIFSFIGFSKKIPKIVIAQIVVLFALYSMVGMARGTSFENFELLILLIFSTLIRTRIIDNRNFYTKSQIIKLMLLTGVIGSAFIVSKALRSADISTIIELEGPTSTLSYDNSSVIMSTFPLVGKIALSFSGYFTFGLYFTSEVFWKIWAGSANGLLGMLLPFVTPLLGEVDSYRITLVSMGVDCGACWDPDISGFSYFLGIPLVLFFIYKLGVLSAKAYNKMVVNHDVAYCLLLYLIVYEMISLHVGNFLVISSSNKILILTAVLIICGNLFYKYRLR